MKTTQTLEAALILEPFLIGMPERVKDPNKRKTETKWRKGKAKNETRRGGKRKGRQPTNQIGKRGGEGKGR